MAYYPQYNNNTPATVPQGGTQQWHNENREHHTNYVHANQANTPHSSTADDAAIAAALQAEERAGPRQAQWPPSRVQAVQQPARVQVPHPVPSQYTNLSSFRVVYHSGVGYRRSPNYNDREQNAPGPNCGQVVKGQPVQGNDGVTYIKLSLNGAALYLPTTTVDRRTMLIQKVPEARTVQPAPVSQPSRSQTNNSNQGFEVVDQRGCAYRKTPSFSDRMDQVAGPPCGTRLQGTLVRGSDNITYLNTQPGCYLPLTQPDLATLILRRTSEMHVPEQQWVVAYPSGIAWRKTPYYKDRAPGAGPAKGTVITGKLFTGYDGLEYVKCSNNQFLPTTLQDKQVLLLQKVNAAAYVAPQVAPQVTITQPQRPAYVTPKPDVRPPAPPPAPPAAATEWTAVQDAQGRTYYWNKTTNKTSWTKPGLNSTQAALDGDLARLSQLDDDFWGNRK